jgi:hypothetical protein
MERVRTYIMNRDGIGFFKSVLESYEDVGIFSVIDGKLGLVEVVYPSHFEKDVLAIIEDMAHYGLSFREVGHV